MVNQASNPGVSSIRIVEIEGRADVDQIDTGAGEHEQRVRDCGGDVV
jgi:hypothetical protein